MFQQLTPVTRAIIMINAIVFVLAQYLLPQLNAYLSGFFPLSPNFRFWQVITHMFMHGSFGHILFNMLTLWSFGPVLEKVLGSRKFLLFYFACGLGSFVLFNLWNYYQYSELVQVLTQKGVDVVDIYNKANMYSSDYGMVNGDEQTQKLWGILAGPMVGASGAIFGVVAGFALLFPNAELFFMFIPFPVKAKYLLPIIVIASLYFGFRQFQWDNIAHFAHLGGALIGCLWILAFKRNRNLGR